MSTVNKENYQIRTVQTRFDPVLVTVAIAVEEHFLRDFTNSVHISALNTNTRAKDNTLHEITT